MNKRFSAQDIPNQPGVYVFRNTSGEVIYVGKAKSLRKRLSSYFQPSRSRSADPKLRALINSINAYELFTVASEAEALLLESRLIKEYHPRYNVDLRDDKRFLHICIDPHEPFPRLRLVRIRKDDGRLYFGPFPQAKVLRQTVEFLSRKFGLRTCPVRSPGVEDHKHCMEQRLKHCMCPCTGRVSQQDYSNRLEQVMAIFNGRSKELLDELENQMKTAAASLRFEDAASLRDIIDNLRSVCDPRRRVFSRATLTEQGAYSPEEAMATLQNELCLPVLPAHIECFDMSTISGHFAVGSMVVFMEGRPCKKHYRRYRIRSDEANDDTGMMREVLTRRYSRLIEEHDVLPDLVVVDGGRGQLSCAMEAFAAAGMPSVPLIGLAKKEEEIHLLQCDRPIVLARHNSALRLLQSIRDEAHRFANSYNRELRRKRIANSVLTEIPGVGSARAAAIIKEFGSVRSLRAATDAELQKRIPGIGSELARNILTIIQARGDRHSPS